MAFSNKKYDDLTGSDLIFHFFDVIHTVCFILYVHTASVLHTVCTYNVTLHRYTKYRITGR